jgi:hypothetical protein
MIVGAGGQLLERSIVDRVVGSPERLYSRARLSQLSRSPKIRLIAAPA